MRERENRALVLLSGGMDSATVAFIAREQFDMIGTLFFRYGQRTEARELECFNNLSDELPAGSREIFDLPFYTQIGKNALTDDSIAIPVDEDDDEIPNAYVPFRNGVMLSIAAAYAEANDFGHIFIGAVWEDSSGYPDCRENFLQAMEKAIDLGTKPENHITLHYPIIHMSKSQIIRRGMELSVPFEFTWSCYSSNDAPCGECPSCKLRARAFAESGLDDPVTK